MAHLIAQPLFAGVDNNGNSRRALALYYVSDTGTDTRVTYSELYACPPVQSEGYSPHIAQWREYWSLVVLPTVYVPVRELREMLARGKDLANPRNPVRVHPLSYRGKVRAETREQAAAKVSGFLAQYRANYRRLSVSGIFHGPASVPPPLSAPLSA